MAGDLDERHASRRLGAPEPGRVVDWVARHLLDLVAERQVRASTSHRGTQAAADAALAALDVAGYAARRNEVEPRSRRAASGLSPWIRHGLLQLPEVWAAVEVAPAVDRAKFRDELCWQEYARHVYARLGRRTGRGLRFEPHRARQPGEEPAIDPTMACLGAVVEELETDGWLVNQSRMWVAGHWSVRLGLDWRDGEAWFFRHLLDGSRAANRLGWQWTVGAATGRPYGFSRRQVERRAPGRCGACVHRHACPIEHEPDPPDLDELSVEAILRSDADPARTAGPSSVQRRRGRPPEVVWLTAESLGDRDPALAAHPDLPAVFVWDAPLLTRLRLSSKRFVFIAERLAELAGDRPVEVHRGDPIEVLAGRRLAATFAPVPGWRRRAELLDVAAVHPWPWLRRPGRGPVGSFSAWRRHLDREPQRVAGPPTER